MGPAEQAEVLLRPHVETAGFELFDVEWRPGLLRVSIDRPGGIDLEAIADLSPVLSRVLDATEPEIVPGRYTLEVSSPGLERPLANPVALQAIRGRQGHREDHRGNRWRTPIHRHPRGRRHRQRRRHQHRGSPRFL